MRTGLEISANSPPGQEELMILPVPVSADTERVDLTRLASPQMSRAFARASDPVTHWPEARMMATDGVTRGFPVKPPVLTMLRQGVRLLPPDLEEVQ